MAMQIKSVLIADEIEQQCLDVLKAANIEVVKKTKLSKDELISELKKHDAVVVRSATKVLFLLIYSDLFYRLRLISLNFPQAN
jgi:D-3-phosphoglycerate dehydrogenase